MCGIFGCFGDLGKMHKSWFENMCIVDSLRGKDSIGILYVSKYLDKFSVVKAACDPWTFLDTKAYDDATVGTASVMIGHNRWATKGKVTDENAHPFHNGKIIGVHNGTIRQTKYLPAFDGHDVDSDAVFASIDKAGVEETWKNLYGAAALAWYNIEDKTINFIRNPERPLYMGKNKYGDVCMFASEQAMLVAMAIRNYIQVDEVEKIEVNKLYTFQNEFPLPTGQYTKKLEDPIITDIKPPKIEVYTYKNSNSWRGGFGFRDELYWKEEEKKEKEQKSSLHIVKKPSPDYEPKRGEEIYFVIKKFFDEYGKSKLPRAEGIMLNPVSGEPDSRNIVIISFSEKTKHIYDELEQDDNVIFCGEIAGISSSGGGSKKKRFIICFPETVFSIVEENINQEDDVPFDDINKGIPREFVKSVTGQLLSKEEFDRRFKECAWCSDPLDFYDVGIEIISEHSCICGECVEQREERIKAVDESFQ